MSAFIFQVKTKYKAIPTNYSFEETDIRSNSSAEDMYEMLNSKKLNPWMIYANRNATEIQMKVEYEYDGVEKVLRHQYAGFDYVFHRVRVHFGANGRSRATYGWLF